MDKLIVLIEKMTNPDFIILDNGTMHSGILAEILTRVGNYSYLVLTAPSQVIEALKICEPKAVFCNVTARNCDTRELCENKELDIPFIFTSDLFKDEERRSCYLESGFPYLSAPFTIDSVAALI